MVSLTKLVLPILTIGILVGCTTKTSEVVSQKDLRNKDKYLEIKLKKEGSTFYGFVDYIGKDAPRTQDFGFSGYPTMKMLTKSIKSYNKNNTDAAIIQDCDLTEKDKEKLKKELGFSYVAFNCDSI